MVILRIKDFAPHKMACKTRLSFWFCILDPWKTSGGHSSGTTNLPLRHSESPWSRSSFGTRHWSHFPRMEGTLRPDWTPIRPRSPVEQCVDKEVMIRLRERVSNAVTNCGFSVSLVDHLYCCHQARCPPNLTMSIRYLEIQWYRY